MKLAVRLTLLMFVLFLSTPTVVSLIKHNCDTAAFFSMTEEELVHHEVKVHHQHSYEYEFHNLSLLTSSLILSENLSKHDNVSAAIFIPPPDFV